MSVLIKERKNINVGDVLYITPESWGEATIAMNKTELDSIISDLKSIGYDDLNPRDCEEIHVENGVNGEKKFVYSCNGDWVELIGKYNGVNGDVYEF